MPVLLSSKIDRLCILTHKQSGVVLEANDIIAQGRATNVITAFPTVRQHTVLTQTHRIMSFWMHLLRPDGCMYMEIWVLSEVGIVFSLRFESQVKDRHYSHERHTGCMYVCLESSAFYIPASYPEPRNTPNFLTPPAPMVSRGSAQASFSKGPDLLNIRSLHWFKVLMSKKLRAGVRNLALVIPVNLPRHEPQEVLFFSWAAIGSSVQGAVEVSECHPVLFPFLIV